MHSYSSRSWKKKKKKRCDDSNFIFISSVPKSIEFQKFSEAAADQSPLALTQPPRRDGPTKCRTLCGTFEVNLTQIFSGRSSCCSSLQQQLQTAGLQRIEQIT